MRGVAFNWIGHACSFVITFFLTPFLVHTLGNQAYGLWAMVMGLTGYYSLADVGLGGTAIKYISDYDATGKRSKVQSLISTLVGCYVVLALSVVVIGLGIAWVFPHVVQSGGQSVGTIRTVVTLVAITFAVQLVGRPFRSGLTAMTRFGLQNSLEIGCQLSRALLLVLVLRAGGGLAAMAWVTLITGALTELTRYWFATKILGGPLLSPALFDRSLVKQVLVFSSGIFVINGGRKIAQNAGILIVGILAGPAAAAFYAIGESLVKKPGQMIGGVVHVVLPVASRLNAQKRAEELIQVTVLVARLLLALALSIAVVVVVFGRRLVDLWIEMGFGTQVYPVVCALAAALVLRQLAGGNAPVLTAMGRLRFNAFVSCGEALFTILLGALLTVRAGAGGMALAVLAVQLVRGIVLSSYTCRSVAYPWASYLLSALLPAVVANVPVVAVALTIRSVMPASSIWTIVGQVLMVLLMSGVVVFLVCLPAHIQRTLLYSFSRLPRRPATDVSRTSDRG